MWLSFWKTHFKLRIPTTSILWFRFCWSFLVFFTLHKLLQLQKTVCFSGQASFCMIPIWLGFCPPLHTLFCCVKYWALFTLLTMWYSKSNLQQDLHMLRSQITAYLQVYCINISHNIPILLIAQVAQVAPSSVVSRGETACVHLREAPEEDSSAHLPTLCPYKYKYKYGTCRYSQITQVKKYLLSMWYISWLCFQQV